MKIAFVSQPLDVVTSPPKNSLAIWTYEVARRLIPSHEVTIYAKGRFQKQVLNQEGIEYRYIPIAFDKVILKLLEKIPNLSNVKRPTFASSLYYLGYALQIANDLKKQKFDVVHIHNFSQFVPIIRALNPQIKIVLHMHCEWLTQLEHSLIEKRIKKSDLVIGCSDYITGKIHHLFPQFHKRCKTIYNGVDIEQFCPNDKFTEHSNNEHQKLLFIGRVSPEKGVHVLLEAFPNVVKLYPQAQLEIVGPNLLASKEFLVALSEEDEVANLAVFYGDRSYYSHLQDYLSPNIANQVSFIGFVPQSEVVNYYRDADVLINPSFSEAFGMSLVQAMATETPVVATRVGGMTEIVEDGITGKLVERGDASALAEAIIAILSDEDLKKSMGKTGRQQVIERFSWEKIANNTLLAYQNIYKTNEQIYPEISTTKIV